MEAVGLEVGILGVAASNGPVGTHPSDVVVDEDPVAELESLDAVAERGDTADRLMAEHLAASPLRVPLQRLAGAQAAGEGLDQNLVAAEVGNRSALDADIARPVVDADIHGVGPDRRCAGDRRAGRALSPRARGRGRGSCVPPVLAARSGR